MSHSSFATRWNLDAIEAAYRQWLQDQNSVDERWRVFFEGFDLGLARPTKSGADGQSQTAVVRLINAYRDLGHFLAQLDPLSEQKTAFALLELSEFGLSEADLDKTFDTRHFQGMSQGTLRDLVAALRETYCRTIGVEFMHIQDTRIRQWLEERMEPRRNQPNMARRQKIGLLMGLHFAELFEKFLHARYIGQKRFSLEGAETLIPMLDAIVEKAPRAACVKSSLAWPIEVGLTSWRIFSKPYQEIFAEFEDNYLPGSFDGDGDVKYHLGFPATARPPRGADSPLTDAQSKPSGSGRSGRRRSDPSQAAVIRRPGAK